MKMHGGADYEALSQEIEGDMEKLREKVQSRLRPDLDRVAEELFAEVAKPELPEGWFWSLVNADGIFLRSGVQPDGVLIETHANMALQPDENDGYVAWIGAKCLQGPREEWKRAAVGITWTDDELAQTPLALLRSKLRAGINSLAEYVLANPESSMFPEGGAFPAPTIG